MTMSSKPVILETKPVAGLILMAKRSKSGRNSRNTKPMTMRFRGPGRFPCLNRFSKLMRF